MQLAEDEGLPRLFDRPFRPETGGPKQFTGEAGKYGKGAEAEKVLTESMQLDRSRSEATGRGKGHQDLPRVCRCFDPFSFKTF